MKLIIDITAMLEHVNSLRENCTEMLEEVKLETSKVKKRKVKMVDAQTMTDHHTDETLKTNEHTPNHTSFVRPKTNHYALRTNNVNCTPNENHNWRECTNCTMMDWTTIKSYKNRGSYKFRSTHIIAHTGSNKPFKHKENWRSHNTKKRTQYKNTSAPNHQIKKKRYHLNFDNKHHNNWREHHGLPSDNNRNRHQRINLAKRSSPNKGFTPTTSHPDVTCTTELTRTLSHTETCDKGLNVIKISPHNTNTKLAIRNEDPISLNNTTNAMHNPNQCRSKRVSI